MASTENWSLKQKNQKLKAELQESLNERFQNICKVISLHAFEKDMFLDRL